MDNQANIVYIYAYTISFSVNINVNKMSVRDIARRQMINRINDAAQGSASLLQVPSEGWVAFVRKALGMSGVQLGKRMSRSRSRISQAEKAEPEGGVTLRAMEEMAKAMGCKFVYGIVPESGRLEDVIEGQARHKAEALVRRATTHMALEKQALSNEKIQAEVERIAQDLLRNPPSSFWET